MLAIRVELLHGTLRAGSADDLALTGQDDPGEWPPSPARLFSALVAACGTGARCRIADNGELQKVESALAPTIIADQADYVLRSRAVPRFVVVDERAEGSVQGYPGRKSKEARPSTRMSPRACDVTYLWLDVALSQEQFRGMRRRAARVAYLGCADSPVRVSVAEEEPAASALRTWRPSQVGMPLPVPYNGFTEQLDAAHERWLVGPSRRAWIRTERVRYSSVESLENQEDRPVVFWLRFDVSIGSRKVLEVTETLRSAVLDLFQRHVAGNDPISAVLHGHGFSGEGYHHAQWLALPDVGYSHSRGRIQGAAVWLPAGTDSELVVGVHTALGHLHELVKSGRFSIPIRPFGGESRPLASRPDRWMGPSRRWISVFPVVHERWSSHGLDASNIERWLAHAGHEAKVLDFRSTRVPLLPGSASLRPEEVHRDGRPRYPYSFIDVTLDREIVGPLVLGRGRQFGLGLMVPRRPDRLDG